MAKKFFSKALSVGLSLALCAGMVAPAFAASFNNLQDAISGTAGKGTEMGNGRYGYGDMLGKEGEDTKYAIEAWTDGDTRHVELNEGVEYKKGDNATITVNGKVNLDMNENTIQGETSWKPKIEVVGKDASLTLDGNGTMSALAQVNVKNGANLTMKNGTLTGFSNNGVVVTDGSTFTMEDGTITKSIQAGVRVKGEGSSFTMKKGTISENNRGGVRVTEGASFEMNDGTITKNNSATEGDGSGVWVANSTFKMSGGKITENYPSGGIAGGNAKIELIAADSNKPIEISNNKGIGVHTWGGSTLTMDGVIVKGNTAGRGSGINTSGDKEVTLKNVTLEGNKGGDSAFFSWKTENVKIENSTIKGNEATTNAVWICYNTAEIKDSDIDGNGANAIAAEYGVKLTVNGKTLYESYADKVGADGTISGIKNDHTKLGLGATILVLDEDGNTVGEIKLPKGGDVDKNGNVTGDLIITKKDNKITDVTIAGKDENGDTTKVEVEVPEDGEADVKVDEEGNVTVTLPAGSTIKGEDGKDIKLTEDGEITIDKDGNVTLPKVDDDDDDNGGTGGGTGSNVFEGYDFGAGTTNIEDEAVPLAAGPVTNAEFIDYLWRHEGRPEADSEFFADHEYADAIAWALSAGLIDEETFQPDELATVAVVRDILDNFAGVFGANAVAAEDLTTLTGEDDEAVLNCDEVLAEFFGEEYVPAKDEEEAAA